MHSEKIGGVLSSKFPDAKAFAGLPKNFSLHLVDEPSPNFSTELDTSNFISKQPKLGLIGEHSEECHFPLVRNRTLELRQSDLPRSDVFAGPATNVVVNINADDKFDHDSSEFAQELRNHIEDSLRYARGGTLIRKKDNGTIIATDPNGVTRVRIGQWDDKEEGEVGTVDEALNKINEVIDNTELGVYRPDLNTRKVGKVRVELVDDGFPLALREVAKVMTWAQTAKGYKDHDWQNLPNAEQALAAATSRHRSDFIIQRQVDKLTPEMCVDHESSISHKAHEAFGVLAQLELLLRGEFK